jgi:hypothetical protein
MTNHNAKNERVKRQCFAFLADAQGHIEQTIEAAARTIARFEAYTRYKDFRPFHIKRAKAFKRDLAEQRNQRSANKTTLYATLTALKRFFLLPAGQPGDQSRISYSDACDVTTKAGIYPAQRPSRVLYRVAGVVPDG